MQTKYKPALALALVFDCLELSLTLTLTLTPTTSARGLPTRGHLHRDPLSASEFRQSSPGLSASDSEVLSSLNSVQTVLARRASPGLSDSEFRQSSPAPTEITLLRGGAGRGSTRSSRGDVDVHFFFAKAASSFGGSAVAVAVGSQAGT